MTRPEIETRSPGPLANTLTARPMPDLFLRLCREDNNSGVRYPTDVKSPEFRFQVETSDELWYNETVCSWMSIYIYIYIYIYESIISCSGDDCIYLSKIKSSSEDIVIVPYLFGWVLWHINHCRLFNAKSSLYIYIRYIEFGWVGFYGISTIVGYLMPNPLYTYILNIYDLVWLGFMAYQPL